MTPLVCCLCGDRHHALEHGQALDPHGTMRRYRQGCTCDECRATNRERARRNRERKAARFRQETTGRKAS